MKKLIFLLLVMVLGTGMVFATTTPEHPPGVLNPKTVMAEYGIHEGIVTQPTVLVMAMPATAELTSFKAVMAKNNFMDLQPIRGFMKVPTCIGCTVAVNETLRHRNL